MATWFKVLLIIDLYALFLILLRPDRKEFFLMFWIDIKERNYVCILVWLLYVILLAWITIPRSLQMLFNNHKNK